MSNEPNIVINGVALQKIQRYIKEYQITTLAGLILAIIGFSYNVWRFEQSEHNNNVRTACFQISQELANLEQLIYSGFYDNDLKAGSPRIGWVKVRLIVALSDITNSNIHNSSLELLKIWTNSWNTYHLSREQTDALVHKIDAVRTVIKHELDTIS